MIRLSQRHRSTRWLAHGWGMGMFEQLELKAQVIALTRRYQGGVVAAVSGGCDSMALLALLAELQREVEFTLAVLHVNFGLRGAESDGDHQHVQAESQARGLPCHVHRITAADLGQRRGRSLQEWARLVRQRELRHYCATHNCIAALAHHRDDLAETALYRLIRGVNVAQLPGMVQFDPPFWRPLLTLPQACLRSLCARQGIAYRTDSSNNNNSYARNRIRNLVMPQLTALHHDAAQHIVTACHQAHALQVEAERELRQRWGQELQQGELSCTALRELPTCKASILLRLLLGNVAQVTVTQVLAKIASGEKFCRQLRRGSRLVGDGQKLRLVPGIDGVKLPRKRQYEQIVQQTRLCFILESGARAETSDGLCVQADAAARQSVCYRLHRPTQREMVRWQGKGWRKSSLPRGAYVCRDGSGQQKLLNARGELQAMLKFSSTGNCVNNLLESRLMAGDST